MERGQIVLLVLLALSIAMLIAGSVMLGVGIHKSKKKCDDQKNCPQCPSNPSAPNYASLSITYLSTYHQSLAWNQSFTDNTSPAFAAAAKIAQDAITAALRNKIVNGVDLTPARVITNSFTMDPYGGTDAYSSLVYPTAVSADTQKAIAAALTVASINAAAYVSPSQQCNGPLYGPPTNITGSTVPPVTTPVPPPTKRPDGSVCDASKNSEAVIVLVDVAQPTVGTLDDKLANVRSLLGQLDKSVALDANNNWQNISFYLIPYYGYQAYTMGSSPCTNHACWMTNVNNLTSAINQNRIDEHNMARGLQYVIEELGNYLPYGIGRTLIVVSDGLDIGRSGNLISSAQQLKNELYTIGLISASRSSLAHSYFTQVVTDASFFYEIPDFTWITNDAVVVGTAQWICNGFYPVTTLPPVKTPLPLITTQPPSTTNAVSTGVPTTTPIANCPIDVIFLLDESQTMLDLYFDAAVAFTAQTANALSALQADSRFALATFNSQPVFNTTYLNVSDFTNALNNIPRETGVADFTIGFTTARTLIQQQSRVNNTKVLPLIVFITDGDQISDDVSKVMKVTQDLRQNYRAEIIALGMNPQYDRGELIKRSIGVGSGDSYTTPYYLRMNSTADLNNAGLQEVVYHIDCHGTPNDNYGCFTDLTFVIETSYATHYQKEIERQAVLNTIKNFAVDIGPFSGRVSLVHFSDAAHTVLDYAYIDNYNTALTKTTSANLLEGGSSDIKTALTLANQTITHNMFGNDQMVILMTRGLFTDGNSSNCCDDPQSVADSLRQIATVQGVVLGMPTDMAEVQKLTQTAPIDANKLIQNPNDAVASGKAIADALKPLIQQKMQNAHCANVEKWIPACQEYVDLTIAISAQNNNSFIQIKQFVAQDLIPSLFGGSLSNTVLHANSPVNLAIISQSFSTGIVHAHFESGLSPQGYADRAAKAYYNSTSTYGPYIYTFYNTAYDLNQQYGRPYATKIVLMVMDGANSQYPTSDKNALDKLGKMAYTTALIVNSNATLISTAPPLYSELSQINPLHSRSARALANQLSTMGCRSLTTPAPPTVQPTTSYQTPSPPPKVKPRNLWPDITFLVDSSFDGGNAMTDEGFQVIRDFIYRYFLEQLWISDKASRITLARFDQNTTVACTFNQMHSYYDFKDCLLNKFVYNVIYPHTKVRDLAGALDSLRSTVYNTSVSGYNPFKENFLVIFTTGSSSTDASRALREIQHKGIRTLAISLGAQMPQSELSLYGFDSANAPNWKDQRTGLLGNNNIGYGLLDYLTTIKQQPMSRFFSDVYLVVDESAAMNGQFDAVKQFTLNFFNQFIISGHRTRVSIIPYSDDVIYPMLNLTSSYQSFINYYNTSYVYHATQSSAHIGNAINTVIQSVGTNPSRAVYVVYIVQSETVTGAENAQRLNAINGVKSFAIPTNKKIGYASQLASSPRFVFNVSSTASLNNWLATIPANPIAHFFQRLNSEQENYRQTHRVTLDELAADVVFAWDMTGLTNQTFEVVRQYILDFTSQMEISKHAVQVAIQQFHGTLRREGGFHFKDAQDASSLKALINGLKFAAPSPNAKSDLAWALDQINVYLMDPHMGWRNGLTYVIMLPSADQFVDSPDGVQKAKLLLQRAHTQAIGLTGKRDAFVSQFVQTPTLDYQTVATPNDLTYQSNANQLIVANIENFYQQLLFPRPPLITEINADVIFLIDHNNLMNTSPYSFEDVKGFLQMFMVKTMNNFGTTSRLGVVSYNFYGVRPQNSFGLNAYTTQAQIGLAVSNLVFDYTYNDPEFDKAIDYFYNNASFGYDRTRCTFVIDIAMAKGVYSTIDDKTSRALNEDTFTFAYVLNNATSPPPFLNKFLRDEVSLDNYVLQPKFPSVDSDIRNFMQNNYQSWLATYGQ